MTVSFLTCLEAFGLLCLVCCGYALIWSPNRLRDHRGPWVKEVAPPDPEQRQKMWRAIGEKRHPDPVVRFLTDTRPAWEAVADLEEALDYEMGLKQRPTTADARRALWGDDYPGEGDAQPGWFDLRERRRRDGGMGTGREWRRHDGDFGPGEDETYHHEDDLGWGTVKGLG